MSKMAVFSLTALSLALGSAPVFAQSETAEGFIDLAVVCQKMYADLQC